MPVLYLGDDMNSRSEYFKDLIADCIHAVDQMEINEEHQGVVIAALIQSDSYNGLRKAMLQAMSPTFVMQRGDKA
jgi:metal-responsive CopG/Arc/MetJ family transcriptional regulator